MKEDNPPPAETPANIAMMKHTTFEFELGQNVRISCSSEHGEVIARAEYQTSEPCYLIRYQAADGRAQQCWWDEAALRSIPSIEQEG